MLPKYLTELEEHLRKSTEVESQRVEGLAYSPGHQGRKADGLWIEHDQPVVRHLFDRMQMLLRLNPAMGEEFLILKYDVLGHYAIHYDHLDPMPVEYDDGWFEFYGNRLATALLLVKTAERGGSTVFPRLNFTIQPDIGDLILWFNGDSNDRRELNALHAACPIQQGEKIAVSLWIRGNYQNNLQCAITHAGYEPEHIIRKTPAEYHEIPQKMRMRPRIPQWIFD
ncbi:2OG-Fe(II) oxygenase superfamily domain-containing protein [Ditylenchus destructor]|uniref:2OG-Fe(II) oxygenase superfamily domain-containing protein n=1 Tax=Ditylenchus destructor TaxID=166010 RepID=A0AAD4RA64_9BILA|nr:2OG-Fe(II) oxygenase superfamily domain-containing protein [Ditylenchus destructor]